MKTRILAGSLFIAAALTLPETASAQEPAQEEDLQRYMELLRSDMRTGRVAALTEVMDLTAAEGEVFWPIYREYEVELAALWDRDIALIREYAEHFETMTDEKARELVSQALEVDAEKVALRARYFDRIADAIPAIKAGRFFQADNQIDLIISLQISQNLPLVMEPQTEGS